MPERVAMERICLAILLCAAVPLFAAEPCAKTDVCRTDALRALLGSADTNYVFVALHQGDHERCPGNTLQSIAGAIEMGADIVEVDVRRTRDGRFVLSHDKPREPADANLPTLEDAVRLTRGRILVNIDKFDAAPVEILREVERLGVRDQVLVKLLHAEPEAAKRIFNDDWGSVETGDLLYMSVVQFCWGREKRAAEVLPLLLAAEPRKMSLYEICIRKPEDVKRIREVQSAPGRPRIWMNAMWDDLAAGHGEAPPPSEAKGKPRRPIDPEACWGWILAQGATVIQTDNGRALLRYLERRGRRQAKPASGSAIGISLKGDERQ